MVDKTRGMLTKNIVLRPIEKIVSLVSVRSRPAVGLRVARSEFGGLNRLCKASVRTRP